MSRTLISIYETHKNRFGEKNKYSNTVAVFCFTFLEQERFMSLLKEYIGKDILIKRYTY